MARSGKTLPKKLDLAHLISTGVLANVVPRPLIDEVLTQTGRGSQRNRLLPAPAVVYFVMALALWRDLPQEEVLRVVCDGVSWLGGEAPDGLAGRSALSQARARLGPEVMRQLSERVMQPLAAPGDAAAWYRGFRLMAVDGSTMEVYDSPRNAERFGYPKGGRGEAAFPQVHLLALVECGTHAVTAATLAPCRTSEQAMAVQLLPSKLQPDMLLMADRGFYSFKLWQQVAPKAALLWRVKSTLKLPVEQPLADGSYLSTVYDHQDRRRQHGQRVRVIDYALEGLATPAEARYQLLTNLLDPAQADALELAALYHERWEIESVFDEFKTHLRGARTVLRSMTPDMVEQELWGLLLAHYAIRQLMTKAAAQEHLDPDRLSFVHAVRLIRRRLPQAAAFPP